MRPVPAGSVPMQPIQPVSPPSGPQQQPGGYQPTTFPAGAHQAAPPSGPPYPGAPNADAPYTAAYSAAPSSATPYSATPYSGAPAATEVGPGYGYPYQPGPGGPGAPGGQPPYGAAPARRSGRIGRGLGLGLAAVLLSLTSGVIGASLAGDADDPVAVQSDARAAIPVLDRSSIADVAAKVSPSVVDISTGEGEGSGVIMSADGAILTNTHVAAPARHGTVTVTFNGGKTASATVVGTDPTGDIAVIKAQNVSGLAAATFGDSSAMRVGDTVLAIGSPLGLQGSVTEGIISALNRPVSAGDGSGSATAGRIADAIQTDAAINPGNSGGALVNLAGQVIGINTAIATSGDGSGSIGLGFAITSNKAKAAADLLLAGKKVAHPYIGVRLNDAEGNGALILSVVDGSPAAKAGLVKGDVVTRAGSKTVADANAFSAAVQATNPGDQLQLTVVRDGATREITVTIGTLPS